MLRTKPDSAKPAPPGTRADDSKRHRPGQGAAAQVREPQEVKAVMLAMGDLVEHPLNPNVMTAEMRARLKRHLAATGLYEPLVVREHPRLGGKYEILNGHHRRQVLMELGHTHAQCVVWPVSDAQAGMLLATLNRLSGADDPKRRARLMAVLGGQWSRGELLKRLPDTRARLERLGKLVGPIELRSPAEAARRPGAMVFFVEDHQRATIEAALRAARDTVGGDDPERRMGRGDLLAVIVGGWLREKEEERTSDFRGFE